MVGQNDPASGEVIYDGAGLQTIHSKRYSLLVSAGLRITYLLSLKRHALVSIPNFLHVFHYIWKLTTRSTRKQKSLLLASINA
jgi:hypothetical protein